MKARLSWSIAIKEEEESGDGDSWRTGKTTTHSHRVNTCKGLLQQIKPEDNEDTQVEIVESNLQKTEKAIVNNEYCTLNHNFIDNTDVYFEADRETLIAEDCWDKISPAVLPCALFPAKS